MRCPPGELIRPLPPQFGPQLQPLTGLPAEVQLHPIRTLCVSRRCNYRHREGNPRTQCEGFTATSNVQESRQLRLTAGRTAADIHCCQLSCGVTTATAQTSSTALMQPSFSGLLVTCTPSQNTRQGCVSVRTHCPPDLAPQHAWMLLEHTHSAPHTAHPDPLSPHLRVLAPHDLAGGCDQAQLTHVDLNDRTYAHSQSTQPANTVKTQTGR